jgi:hypothetical protein
MQEVPAPVDSAASLKPDATSLAQVAKPIPGPTARLQPAPASAARRHDVPASPAITESTVSLLEEEVIEDSTLYPLSLAAAIVAFLACAIQVWTLLS